MDLSLELSNKYFKRSDFFITIDKTINNSLSWQPRGCKPGTKFNFCQGINWVGKTTDFGLKKGKGFAIGKLALNPTIFLLEYPHPILGKCTNTDEILFDNPVKKRSYS